MGGVVMKRPIKDLVCELRAAGWRIYLDGQSTAEGAE
jgi:hypothetical protein